MWQFKNNRNLIIIKDVLLCPHGYRQRHAHQAMYLQWMHMRPQTSNAQVALYQPELGQMV